ncbi:2649_t:CDS:1 [Paraglomus occultum]|uniref:2649_t:CDS:1 n=1 Tax=Paraglomus occultum TaxID=144539 RepID=A0A9N9FCI5_9GLOM|nr:2649_t:CDS:1 [Paraglomus occultum]
MDGFLPHEILTMITDKFSDNSATLYSCILINKNWYSAAIQHLWSNPFTLLCAYRYRCVDDYRRKAKNLLTTFIECFTDMESIKEESVSLYLERKHSKKLIFDYSLYLKEIYFGEVQDLLCKWCHLKLDDCKFSHDLVDRMAVGIIRFAIQYCPRLKTLFFPHKFPSILLIQSLAFARDLPQLRNFIWASHYSHKEVFIALSKVAHNLELISVDFRTRRNCLDEGSMDAFQALIRSQHRLKTVRIRKLNIGMDFMLELLQTQSSSLEWLSFEHTDFGSDDSKFGPFKFPQLKRLKLGQCVTISTHGLASIIMADLPNLQQLIIDPGITIPIKFMKQMLQKHGRSLTSATLKLSNSNVDIVSSICQNLRQLDISMSKELIMPVVCMLANIPNLHSLTINSLSERDPPFLGNLFNELAKHQLSHLHDLSLSNMDSCHVDSLKKFLSGSRPPLRSLTIGRTCVMTEAHINVILDHLKDTLKFLTIYFDINAVSTKCIGRARRILRRFYRPF